MPEYLSEAREGYIQTRPMQQPQPCCAAVPKFYGLYRRAVPRPRKRGLVKKKWKVIKTASNSRAKRAKDEEMNDDDDEDMQSRSSRFTNSGRRSQSSRYSNYEEGEYEEHEVEMELTDRMADEREEEESKYIMLMEECGSQVSVDSLCREHKCVLFPSTSLSLSLS